MYLAEFASVLNIRPWEIGRLSATEFSMLCEVLELRRAEQAKGGEA